MLKILDDETAYWLKIPDELGLFEWVDQLPETEKHCRSPHHLRMMLHEIRGMNLSAANKERLQKHAGLKLLDDVLANHPRMKPEKTPMVEAHQILRDIRAGKFRKD